MGFYRAWDPRSSMIQAFASLFFLSYAKLIYLIWVVFQWSECISNINDSDIKLFTSIQMFLMAPINMSC